MTSTLHQRAHELGVQTTYEDVDQVDHLADDEVIRRVVEILEADRIGGTSQLLDPIHVMSADSGPHSSGPHSIRIDRRVDDAALLVDGTTERVGVRRSDDHTVVDLPEGLPVGCHTLSVQSGADADECLVVRAPVTMPGLSTDRRWSSLFVPAYALWEDDGPLPSFRHLGEVARRIGDRGIDMLATLPLYAAFLEEPFDPSPYSPISRLHWNEVYIDDATLPAAAVPPLGDLVDWRALGSRRRSQLIAAASTSDPALTNRLDQFMVAHPDVGAYARFRAGREADGDPIVERSHVLAQMMCDEQLAEIGSNDAGAASLSLDLPIGSHPDGYETWAFPELFAPATAVGAPPDTFFTEGQNWGFPPQLPGEMRRTGYQLWRQMIERAGRHAAMLRIDHVMAVHRLWWVPDGFSADRGVYVRYPHDEMLAVIAASAAAADVTVVGENLGTVPPEVVDALDSVEMLGMYEEQFMTAASPLPVVPERTVAGIRTHDMPAFAAHVASTDLGDYRRRLAADTPATDTPASSDTDLFDAVLTRLARSDARMVVADLDDLLGETRPHNLPGRVVPGIWQRRLDRSVSDTLTDPVVERRLDILERT